MNKLCEPTQEDLVQALLDLQSAIGCERNRATGFKRPFAPWPLWVRHLHWLHIARAPRSRPTRRLAVNSPLHETPRLHAPIAGSQILPPPLGVGRRSRSLRYGTLGGRLRPSLPVDATRQPDPPP